MMFYCEIDDGYTLTPLIIESQANVVSALCDADDMTGVGWLCNSLDSHYLIRQTQQLWATAKGLRVLIQHSGCAVGMAEVVISGSSATLGYYAAQTAPVARALRALVDYALTVMDIEHIVLRCPSQSTACHRLAESLGLPAQHIARDETRYGIPVDAWQRHTPPVFKYLLNNRAYLQLLHANHADTLLQLIDANRTFLRRWLPDMGMIYTHDDVLEYIGRGLSNLADTQGFQCGIWCDDTLVGVIAYNFIDRMAAYTELGYWLGEGYQGQGFMTRAVQMLTHYAFEVFGLKRVGLRIAVANTRSRALAKRLGFTEDAALRHALWLYDQQPDQVLYTIRSDNWWNKHQRAASDGFSAEGRSGN